MRNVGAALFLLLIFSPPVLYFTTPVHKTAAYTPLPAWSTSEVLDGSWMKRLENHLQESSLVTWHLRGLYAENMFRLGLYDSELVLIGKRGWFFLADSLELDAGQILAARARRVALIRTLRQRLDTLGVHLLVVFVPDKVRIYPELLFASGQLPALKAQLYDETMSELREAGVESIDARKVLLAAKRDHPEVVLYQHRDTHWSVAGASRVAEAAVARLRQLGWDRQLGKEARIHLGKAIPDPNSIADLIKLMDFRADSRLVAEINDPFIYVPLIGPDGEPVDPVQPAAKLALCGSSFSDANFMRIVPARLRRLADCYGVGLGQGAFQGILTDLERIKKGELAPRVVIWEFVERGCALDPQWLDPPAPAKIP